jgi:transcriptional regulator with XRE-family HTH domain
MTQEELADKIGVTFQQLQKYEKGVNRISASRLQELSHLLKVPVQFFFEGLAPGGQRDGKGGDVASQSIATDFLASSEGLAVAEAFAKIKNRTLRRALVQFIREIGRSCAGAS